MENNDIREKANEDLKRIMLFMNYDSKKTLEENQKKVNVLTENKQLLLEYNIGNWTADKYYSLNDPLSNVFGKNYSVRKGSIFEPKGDIGPNNWAFCSNNPWDREDPLVFQCKKITVNGIGTHMWEPEGSGSFWAYELNWPKNYKPYLNNELEEKLKNHFCVAKKNSGGGTSLKNTNMANNDVKYWKALYDSLANIGLTFRTGGKEVEDAQILTYKNFTIDRNYSPFIRLKKEDGTFIKGSISKNNVSPYRYAGERDLKKLKLRVEGVEDKDFMSLFDFLELDAGKSVKDNTGGKKNSGGGTGGGKTGGGKTGGGTGGGGTTGGGTTWKSCSGTYTIGCKSPNITRMQECLKKQGFYNYRVDDKFGSKTQTAVKNALGKTSFTDSDITTFCAKNNSNNQFDFDQDQNQNNNQSQDSGAWSGDVY